MKNDNLQMLNREQLIDAVEKALVEINDSYQEVMNTADLWEWVGNESQESHCRCFAGGLDIAKQLLEQAIKAVTPSVEVLVNVDTTGKSKVCQDIEERIAQ